MTFALTALCDGSNVKEFFSKRFARHKTINTSGCATRLKSVPWKKNTLSSRAICTKEWCLYKGLPMVTVVCITYAHEKFIAEALDSFLMQKN